jgi:hypothetical protein
MPRWTKSRRHTNSIVTNEQLFVGGIYPPQPDTITRTIIGMIE